ncbi:CYTH domain-containing protein [Verrucomicrobiota bacterium sgz303538]
MREIERKFLVRELPPLEQCARYEIEQGYLATELGRSEVRLRRSNGERCLTVKRDRRDDGDGVHSRDELNVSLDPAQWDALWRMTEGRRVTKIRYDVPCGEWTIEVDVFTGKNEGVITAEVEFPDADASRAFQPPPWLGEEITREPKYSNWQLAG